MTARLPCPPAPGPLEAYAACFDEVLSSLAQRRGFREYLTGLLAPRDRNKTLTALAGAEPIAQAQHPAVQRLQWFLSESPWDPERINARRLGMLLAEAATTPHERGVLVIDDSGDRKYGTATAHVGHQWLGRWGKTENCVVTVTTLWADEHLYYPLHAQPYTPAHHFVRGRNDPGFRTKPQLAADLVRQALTLPVACAAVVADCAYGDNEEFRVELRRTGLPYVVALKPHKGTWAREMDPHTPVDAAQALAWGGPDDPGDWTAVERHFRDGHTECWWAADARLAGWGPDRPTRLVVATTDPATLPEKTTWYLTTDLPRPGSPRAKDSPYQAADYAEIVRLYGLRTWVEQSYKQIKDELGWADFQVRSDLAIRRHQALVCCAFSFCWRQGLTETLSRPGPASASATDMAPLRADAGERGARGHPNTRPALVAASPAGHPQLADPGDHAATLVAGLVGCAPTGAVASPARRRRRRSRPVPVPPTLS